jgi:hypothetical protein
MMIERYGHDLDTNAYSIDLIEDLTLKRYIFKGDATKKEDIAKFLKDHNAGNLVAESSSKKLDKEEYAEKELEVNTQDEL